MISDGRETSNCLTVGGVAPESSVGARSAASAGATQRMPHPLLIVLSGPSGVGKTTLTRTLVSQGWPGHIVVTATTRRPRPGEIDGVHYHFYSEAQFRDLLARNELLEHAEVHGNWYGVPAAPVRERLQAGQDVLLTIDPQGAQSIRARTNGACFVFMAPESLDELVTRLDARNLDGPEQRTLRLINAEREMAEMTRYDYAIINRQGHFDEAVAQLNAILTAEHCRVNPPAVVV
ncbi:MAG TPA: guanylate kinase [Ktedonobacterales bacterium]|nr:guanylate kinase [Ktedonobacterales bacterium]